MTIIILTAAPARLEIVVDCFVDGPLMGRAIASRPLNSPTTFSTPQLGVEGSFTVGPAGNSLIEFLRAQHKRFGIMPGSDVPAGEMFVYQDKGNYRYDSVSLASGTGIERELETHKVRFKSASKTQI